MIKVALLHPSFNRPQMAYNAFINWTSNAKTPQEIEYLIGLDNRDTSYDVYKAKLSDAGSKVGRFVLDVSDSTCGVQAVNRVATMISDTTELLVEVCDDVDSIVGWDIELFKLLEGVDNFSTPKMISTHDGLRDYGIVCTQPIINRACYNKFGYVIFPEYTSMWADNDFTEVARRTGYLIEAPHILFKHKHYTTGLTPLDTTYRARATSAEFATNEEVFMKRQKRNFDL